MRQEWPRRQVLSFGAAVGGVALMGCLGDGDEPIPEPASVEGELCDVCGMVIGEHFGPNAQIFYRGGDPPSDRDGPAWFDSVREGLDYHSMQVDRGHEKLVMYVIDYASVGFDVIEHNENLLISTHTDADDFVDIRNTVLVEESVIEGAMGPDIIPFSEKEAAEAFVAKYDGRITEPVDLIEQ